MGSLRLMGMAALMVCGLAGWVSSPHPNGSPGAEGPSAREVLVARSAALVARGSQPVSWQVPCEGALCSAHPQASSLDELCVAALAVQFPAGGAAADAGRCKVVALGGLGGAAGAVRRVGVLELIGNTPNVFTAVLALEVGKHWVAARPLSHATKLSLLSVTPADVRGLSAPSARIEIALESNGAHEEQTFVCGVDGAGAPSCPVVVRTAVDFTDAAHAYAAQASALGALLTRTPASFRANVEINGDGFVVRPASGELPSGMPGEHRWGS